MSFTPGPWEVERRKKSITAIGPCVADEYAGSAWLDVTNDDARLIAAAPELLEALIELERAYSRVVNWEHPGSMDPNPAVSSRVAVVARNVIAKARGEGV